MTDERKAFEDWYAPSMAPNKKWDVLARGKYFPEQYAIETTEHAWSAWSARAALSKGAAQSAPRVTSATSGYALAMRVLQSNLYGSLDDRERAECDELVRLGQSAAPAPAGDEAAALLFDFGGFLTSHSRQWVFSSSAEAAPMVEAIREFAAKRGISLDAAPASAAQPVEAKAGDAIKDALLNYRCTHFADEDGGLPLSDALAAALDDRGVGRALEEIELIADAVYNELFPATPPVDAPAGAKPEAQEPLKWSQSSGGYRLFTKDGAEINLLTTPVYAFRAAQSAEAPAGADAARLDWLQEHGATVDLVPAPGFPMKLRFRIGGLHAAVDHDIRKAIDAALQATPASGGDGNA